MNPMFRAALKVFGTVLPNRAARWYENALLTPRPVRGMAFPKPASTGHFERVPHGDGWLAELRWGHGPTVLLLHGWGGTSASLGAFVDPLVHAGYRVVTFDFPAHGHSDGVRTNIVECAEAVLGIGRRVGPLAGAVTHSFGGPVLALAMRRGLDPARVAMIAPPQSIRALSYPVSDRLGVPRKVADRMFDRFAARMHVDWTQLETDRMMHAAQVPLLVVHDEDDPVVPWSHGAQIARAAPAGRLVTTSGLGHRDLLVDPAVVRGVTDFVAGRQETRKTA